jgi:hypothetical protein
VKLAEDVNVTQTPMLIINGRQIPVSAVSYNTLKKIVEYQAKQDGVAAQSFIFLTQNNRLYLCRARAV